MKLLDLTLKQIKTVEMVIYQDTFAFTDSDLFNFVSALLHETLTVNPDVRLFDGGVLMKIDGDLLWWFENQISLRSLNND